MRIDEDPYGMTDRGEAVSRFTFANDSGVTLQAINYGATITALRVPDRAGDAGDVVLGFDSLDQYERESPYFGAVVGRYANRLAHARFVLDGATYPLAPNEPPHHLHGGVRGFDKRVWSARIDRAADRAAIVFSRVSPDGEEHYPGKLRVQVTYTLGEDNSVTLDYSATTDAPTILNLTNHTYFDLSAGAAPDVLGHLLTLRASRFTPVSAGLIPTGELAPVHHTPFDFRTPHPIGERISAGDAQLRHGAGYDHNWVLDPSGDGDEPPISVFEPVSGRRLDVWTTEPGVQFYSGNRLAPLVGKGQRRYGCRSGFCLETQHFPDSPSHPTFPSTVLRPGATFRSRTVWKFGWRKARRVM